MLGQELFFEVLVAVVTSLAKFNIIELNGGIFTDDDCPIPPHYIAEHPTNEKMRAYFLVHSLSTLRKHL